MLPPPINGEHRFAYCQNLYLDVHKFLATREWAPTDRSRNGGTTWLGFFILSDTDRSRSKYGQHIKSHDAKKRAQQRKAKRTIVLSSMQDTRHNDATVLPTLFEELHTFKSIVREIIRREATRDEISMFKVDRRDELRRLADLGVLAHQPAIGAFCDTTDDERDTITRCIVQQRVGATPKALKTVEEQITDLRNTRGLLPPTGLQANTILIKKAKVALNHTVKWKRNINTAFHPRRQPAHRDSPEVRRYTSRLLKCTKCDHSKETRWMQLRTRRGYRDIYCSNPICKQHERCTLNKCQCGLFGIIGRCIDMIRSSIVP